jgi:hypothetical protein
VRKRIFTPPPSEITFEVRNFNKYTPVAQSRLEMSALQFILGFEFAIEYPKVDDFVTRLETLEREYRGFAYEGAAMATTLRDGLNPLKPGGGNLTTDFLSEGLGASHIFMAYLGIGFALARLPKFAWKRALPDQSRLPDHPTLNWFVIDGYAFHQAFFETDKWVNQQYVHRGMVWEGNRDYVPRVLDHGVGRAMWFVAGGEVERLTSMINSFDPKRHSDLWSGAALAATYAGGVDEDSLELFLKNCGEHRVVAAQGAVFALKARVLANTTAPHNEMASQIFCGRSAEEASSLADIAVIDLPPDGPSMPAYEEFRQRIQRNFH